MCSISQNTRRNRTASLCNITLRTWRLDFLFDLAEYLAQYNAAIEPLLLAGDSTWGLCPLGYITVSSCWVKGGSLVELPAPCAGDCIQTIVKGCHTCWDGTCWWCNCPEVSDCPCKLHKWDWMHPPNWLSQRAFRFCYSFNLKVFIVFIHCARHVFHETLSPLGIIYTWHIPFPCSLIYFFMYQED